jgi:cellulose 1,4-beta-cellobiosidase
VRLQTLPLVAAVVAVGAACAEHAGVALQSPPASPAPDANPFDGARPYVNPDYVAEIESAVAAAPSEAPRLRKLEAFPTAIWLDTTARAAAVGRYLDDAAAQQAAAGMPVLPLFVLYDLPNRDCGAASSVGELDAEHDGEKRYQAEFVDRVAAQFASHPSLRIAAILEPDSLANIATNLDHPRCAASRTVYLHSIAYAIRTLSMPNVSLYLDAAHAGWLGWNANRAKLAQVYVEVMSLAGGQRRVRGFATNVSNYNSLDRGEGARLEPSDPCPDELSYVHHLAESLAAAGIPVGGFIVDTSRNGQAGARSKWASWCNVRGAGLGARPRASPAPGIDAYCWVKPPGESDGTSDPTAPRYDASCSSPDSAPGAPQAGVLFPTYLAQLAALADPPL